MRFITYQSSSGPALAAGMGEEFLPLPERPVFLTKATTAEFIFNIPAIIEWLSLGLTLLPGDIIATGTPAGVGFARTPPEFLRPGDTVQCEVDGVGVIRNRVCAA